MSQSEPTVALLERIATMERQIVALRRELAVEETCLPDQPFQILEVMSGDVRYGIPLQHVNEVLAMLWCDPLPESPAWVMGTFHYDSRLVPVVDLKARLGYEATRAAPEHIIVILDLGNQKLIGVAAEQLGDLPLIDPESVRKPPGGIPQTPFLSGSLVDDQGGTTLLLSLERLCHDSILELDAE